MLNGINIPLRAPTSELKANLEQATEYVKKYSIDVDAYSKKAVESQVSQIEKLKALKVAYSEAASAAKKGSTEQIAALKLQADATKRLELAQGAAAEKSSLLGSGLGFAGTKAKEAGGSFRQAGEHIFGMAKLFLGAAGIFGGAEMFKSAIDGAESYEAKLRQVDAALRNTGASVSQFEPVVKRLADSGAALGYTNTEILAGFQSLTLITHNAADAYHYMGLAEDLSRAKGISLQAATVAVGKAIDGKTTALQRYGIVVQKGESVQSALNLAERVYHGQALAGTTATQKLHASLANMEEHVGQALLPTISRLLNSLSDWFNKTENQKKITDIVINAFDDLKTTIGAVWKAGEFMYNGLEKVKNLFGDWKPVIIGVTAALVAMSLVSPWAAIAAGAVYVISHWSKVKGWFHTFEKYMTDTFTAIKNAVEDLVKGMVYTVLEYVTAGVQGVLQVASHLPFVGGQAKAALHAIQDQINRFKPDWSNIAGAFKAGGAQEGTSFGQNFVTAAQAQMNGLSVPAGGSVNADAAAKGAHGLAMSGATGGGRMNNAQIYQLLIGAGFTPDQARNFVGIAGAESGGRYNALNDNPGTGDYSVGLFQENFFRSLGPARTARYAPRFGLSGNMSPEAFVKWLESHPAAQAQIAKDLFDSSGYSPWMGDAYVKGHPELLGAPHGGGGGITPNSPVTYGPTKKPKAPTYKIPDALEAHIRAAQDEFKNDVTKSHLATLVSYLKQEKALLETHHEAAKAQSIQNEINDAENKLKKAIEAAHKKLIAAQQKAAEVAAVAVIAKITKEAAGPEAALKLAQAAGAPTKELEKDQEAVVRAYQDEAAKLRAHLKTATAKAKQKYQQALAKVAQQVQTAQDSVVSSLQQLAQDAQSNLTSLLQTIQQQADQALGNQYYQNGLMTPSEALLKQMQDEDTQNSLKDSLQSAIDQLAQDQTAGADAATLANDQKAIDQAQRQITENELQIQATRERTQADQQYAQAQFNLNAKLATLIQNVGDGSATMSDLNGVLGQFGIQLSGLSDPGGNGLLTQLQDAIKATTDAFAKLTAATGSGPSGSGSGPSGSGTSTSGASGTSAITVNHGPGGVSSNKKQGVFSIHALGGAGTVFGPHVFLAGENGPEDFMFMPHGRASIAAPQSGGGDGLHIHFDGPVYADSAGIQRLTEQVYAELLRKKKRTGNLSLS